MTTEVAVEELAVKFRKQQIGNIKVETLVNITSDSSTSYVKKINKCEN